LLIFFLIILINLKISGLGVLYLEGARQSLYAPS
jgi:hypothetical protein